MTTIPLPRTGTGLAPPRHSLHTAAPRTDVRRGAASVSPTSPDAPHTAAAEQRCHERHLALDALRGLAALIVVVHHTLLLAPWGQSGDYPGLLDPLMHTPLHLLVDGPASVWMFFVLSGIVVMMPTGRWGRRDWSLYLPRRLVRLYLPAAASVPLALGAWYVFRAHVPGESGWAASHHTIDAASAVRKSLTLINGTTMLNSPLWSLRWELIFSMIFPLLAVLVHVLRRVWPVVVAGALGLSWWAMAQPFRDLHTDAARYLPLFVVGVVIAQQLPRRRDRLATLPRSMWWVAAALAACATSAPAMSGHLLPHLEHPESIGVIGASALVFVVAAAPIPTRLVARPSLRWLASRSFALYLVHEPLVVACSGLLRSANPVVVGLLALPLSLVAAETFSRAVERPAQRLARRIGARGKPAPQTKRPAPAARAAGARRSENAVSAWRRVPVAGRR